MDWRDSQEAFFFLLLMVPTVCLYCLQQEVKEEGTQQPQLQGKLQRPYSLTVAPKQEAFLKSKRYLYK